MVAWACSDDASLALDVEPNDTGFQVTVNKQASPDSPVRYGPQPPQLATAAPLMLMNDKDDWDKGPAYFFQHPFDKFVIVRENDLHDPANIRKRWWDAYSDDAPITPTHERTSSEDTNLVKPTERPWYCFWNATILEAFLYINYNVTQGSNSSIKTSAPTVSASTDFAYPSIPSNVAAPSSAYPSSTTRKRSQVDQSGYTKVCKIEERRQPGAPVPYCQQFQMLANGGLGPLNYPGTQDRIKVMLDEDEPTQQKTLSPWKRTRWSDQYKGAKSKRDNSGLGCQCQWVVQ